MLRKASCPVQVGQEGQLTRSGRSGRPVVQVRLVRKASCPGQVGQEGHLFRSGRSGDQSAHLRISRGTKQTDVFKNRRIGQRTIVEKLNFGSCNVYEIIAGLGSVSSPLCV